MLRRPPAKPAPHAPAASKLSRPSTDGPRSVLTRFVSGPSEYAVITSALPWEAHLERPSPGVEAGDKGQQDCQMLPQP